MILEKSINDRRLKNITRTFTQIVIIIDRVIKNVRNEACFTHVWDEKHLEHFSGKPWKVESSYDRSE
jgi:hypothetical protein